MRDEQIIDLSLLTTTTLYAAFLEAYKHRWEPDWTWLEVVAGTAMCLGAASLRTRLDPAASWQSHEQNVARAFIVGGFPVIAWQVGRMIKHDYARYLYRQGRTNGTTSEAMAEECGSIAANDD